MFHYANCLNNLCVVSLIETTLQGALVAESEAEASSRRQLAKWE